MPQLRFIIGGNFQYILRYPRQCRLVMLLPELWDYSREMVNYPDKSAIIRKAENVCIGEGKKCGASLRYLRRAGQNWQIILSGKKISVQVFS